MTNKSATQETITIAPIETRRVQLLLVGDSPLICHAWSKKAKQQMLDKQMKKATKGKDAKDPERDFKESLYPLAGGSGYGFPAVGFKAAAVSACRFVDQIKMTQARGAFHVVGELVPILGSDPVMREDMVRIGNGVADIRYRGEFREWHANPTIEFNSSFFSLEQIVNLFNQAGFGVGIGEWRPERDGQYGRFHVGAEDERKLLLG